MRKVTDRLWSLAPVIYLAITGLFTIGTTPPARKFTAWDYLCVLFFVSSIWLVGYINGRIDEINR